MRCFTSRLAGAASPAACGLSAMSPHLQCAQRRCTTPISPETLLAQSSHQRLPRRRVVPWAIGKPTVPVTSAPPVPPQSTTSSTNEAPQHPHHPHSDDFLLPPLEEYLSIQAQRNESIRQRLKECLGPEFGSSKPVAHQSIIGSSTSSSEPLDEHTTELLRNVSGKLVVREHVTETGINWWDITAHPTAALEEYRGSIASVLVGLGAHETLVEATLETVLLPQTTNVEGCQCLVVRCAAEDTSFDMDSIQELTNRLTILVFRAQKRVVTVHRTHMLSASQLMKKWNEEQQPDGIASSLENLVLHFVKETCRSFHRALAKSIVEFDNYEAKLFAPERKRSSMARQIYHIKRRASVYSRILVLTQDAFSHLIAGMGIPSQNVYVQDVMQDMTHVRSLSDELNDNANAVLQLLFQLSSYQLNELMRVLTMFSAFFIPLSFIASVYGMNFEHLPGMADPNGHLYCLSFMLCVGVTIVLWFKVKKFW
ncbi:magnesium and cobalt transporter, putative [Bodo saltans]|uniref:Magnesium and cobalt transporter, putative n=1 Tax=Bodo saltans TaxID=75058 RepID=A0A0S4JKD2_BODSA|nr:magnesium and cobalt transporter, putative [Bodo saltans]|eukprot:CUG90629.1 magnesium and cobalt transporter, putative [Bodo saltans]